MAPGGIAPISRPRAATSARRVGEREDAGEAGGHVLADRVAEHRRGRTPQAIQSRASAYSTANSAGWVSAVRASAAAASASPGAAKQERPQIAPEPRQQQVAGAVEPRRGRPARRA